MKGMKSMNGKNFFGKGIALIMVAVMLSATCLPAMAEARKISGDYESILAENYNVTTTTTSYGNNSTTDIDLEFEGSISGKGVEVFATNSAPSGYSLKVDGDVTSSEYGQCGASVGIYNSNADDADVSLTVDGNVTATGEAGVGIWADGEKVTAIVGKNVSSEYGNGIYALYGATVAVGGDVSAKEGTAVNAIGGSVVKAGYAPVDGEWVAKETPGSVKGMKGVDASGENTIVDINGSVEATNGIGVHAVAGGEVEVTGEVISTDGNGVTAAYNDSRNDKSADSTVTVNGDVTGYAATADEVYAVYAEGSGEATAETKTSVTVSGDVNAKYAEGVEDPDNIDLYGVYAGSCSEVNVSGSVNSDMYGVVADNGSVVRVEGNVDTGYIAAQSITGTVEVAGDVKGDFVGAQAAYMGSICIDGDVEGGKYGVLAAVGGNVVVSGDVTATEEGGTAVVVIEKLVQTSLGNDVIIGGDVEGTYAIASDSNLLAAGSKILIKGENVTGKYGIIDRTSGEVTEAEGEDLEAMKTAVYFIVERVLGEGVEASAIELSGTDTETYEGLEVANEGTLTLKITDSEKQYKVSTNKNATAVENEDGSYTITVQRGKVQVIVNLSSEKDPKDNDKKSEDEKPEDGDDDTTTYTVQSVTVVELKPVFSGEAYVPTEGEAPEIKAAILQGEAYINENLAKTIVKVDGEAIDAENYTAEVKEDAIVLNPTDEEKEDALVISLTNEYIETLDAGEHTVEVIIGSAAFKVVLEKTDGGEYFVKEYVKEAEA